jgi:hypothetical protein
MSLTPAHGEEAGGTRLEDLRASLKVKDGVVHDDFDFDLHI